MADNLEITVNNEEQALEIRLFSDHLSSVVKNIAEDIADFAEKSLRANVPIGKTHGLRDSIVRTPVTREIFTGEFTIVAYESRVIVGAPYARAVNEGTGKWGPKKKKIIAPAGNAFKLLKDPKPGRHTGKNAESGVVFTKVIEGQKPQYFLQKTEAETSVFTGVDTNFNIDKLSGD